MSDDRSCTTRRSVLKTTGTASVLGSVALAGCSGNGGDGGDGSDGGEGSDGGDGSDGGSNSLEITGVWSGGEQESFSKVMDYVEESTGMGLEYFPRDTDSLLTGTLMDYESGVASADIVVMPSPARIISDAQNGHLAPVGDAWDADNFAVDPSRVTVDGEVYAAPFKMDLKPGFWYRKSFFNEHDLSEPESWDEFMTLLDDISGIDGVDAPVASGNGTGWPLSDLTEGFFMRQEDGASLQQGLIDGDASFTDDRVATAFDEIKMLHEEGYFSQTRDFGVQYEYFWDNSLPLYFMGSFTPAQDAVEDPSDLGVFRLPGTDGISSSVNWFTVPKYSDNVDAARDALSSFVSAEGQQVWVEDGGFIASNTEVPDDAYEIEVMANLPDLAAEVTVVPDLDDALGNPFQQEFWSVLKGLWATPDTPTEDIVGPLDDAHQETLSN
ncbi:family 1 extracellular solute-binding protein [Halorubrum californiense DSM 19288]|uniref:Family 1 extracellular solute-binding protein n=1 Tax=Halorubrum californiense DSM 19288 TaxID=1227465 RepID=M0EAC8_9EURY|nr:MULTISPECIES: ABC transporter substrate-binding protein [Halorubrum]ELZ44715.1 family 1 extracellular solute-binding protein [Halorubrum californiense DSM 19288]